MVDAIAVIATAINPPKSVPIPAALRGANERAPEHLLRLGVELRRTQKGSLHRVVAGALGELV